jgi:hypothetical protein
MAKSPFKTTAPNAAHGANVTPKSLASANLNASECALFMPAAARNILEGKVAAEKAKANVASGLDIITAAFASEEFTGTEWAFDVMQGNDVAYHVTLTGDAFFFEDDRKGSGSCAWAFNGEGALSKASSTFYKNGFMHRFFNLAPAKSDLENKRRAALWTAISKGVTVARAIRDCGAVASIEGGKLKVTGGTGPIAEKLTAAKSHTAMQKVASGSQTGGANTRKGEGEGKPAAVEATPADIVRLALGVVKGAIAGDVALTNAALSDLNALVKLVTDKADAFAVDF